MSRQKRYCWIGVSCFAIGRGNQNRIEAGRRSFASSLRIVLPVHFVSEYLTTAGGFRRHGTHGISGKPRTGKRRKEGRTDEGAFYSTAEFVSPRTYESESETRHGNEWESLSSFLTFPSVRAPPSLFFHPLEDGWRIDTRAQQLAH